jgi:hypothetical protein
MENHNNFYNEAIETLVDQGLDHSIAKRRATELMQKLSKKATKTTEDSNNSIFAKPAGHSDDELDSSPNAKVVFSRTYPRLSNEIFAIFEISRHIF